MSMLTDYGEELLAEFVRGGGLSLPSDLELGLLTAASDSSHTEVAWPGYSRVVVPRSLANWAGTQSPGSTTASTGTSHQTSNNGVADFGTVGSGGSATITHVGLFEGDSNGELIAYAALDTPLSVSESDPISFPAGTIIWTLGLAGGLSNFLSNRLIDLVWRGQSYSMPGTMYASLYTTAPTNAGGGVEVSGGSYARVGIPTNSSGWDRTGGELSNDDDVIFSNPTGNWGTIVASGLHDAVSSGNLLFWENLAVAKTITAGGPAPRFEIGERKIRFS